MAHPPWSPLEPPRALAHRPDILLEMDFSQIREKYGRGLFEDKRYCRAVSRPALQLLAARVLKRTDFVQKLLEQIP